MYSLIISKRAAKFIKSRSVSMYIKEAIDKKILSLKTDPYPAGSKKLKGTNYFRVRQGNYRIVYEVRNKVLVIVIINIAHRKNIYKSLQGSIP